MMMIFAMLAVASTCVVTHFYIRLRQVVAHRHNLFLNRYEEIRNNGTKLKAGEKNSTEDRPNKSFLLTGNQTLFA